MEAARLEGGREEREAFLAMLHEELQRQSAAKGVRLRLPPAPEAGGSVSAGVGADGMAGGGDGDGSQ